MNYKLAKQLKDAGFAQNPLGHTERPNSWVDDDGEYSDYRIPSSNLVYVPTLSELIKACSDDVFELMIKQERHGYETYWEAGYWEDLSGTGKTPEEAVANFWLELNKKNE